MVSIEMITGQFVYESILLHKHSVYATVLLIYEHRYPIMSNKYHQLLINTGVIVNAMC